ncbi:Transcriptional regulator, LysR family OS=Tsukamurella paurometabola (strain ATCC 8368 / DSM/ CCUG 35730 / CIP 100753 / JCM 10117 / KCTC 9821 / NBRC 16120/ NCIMB 702349 / NCTC 13040) OX=521096 GN=Tpau_3664 PE=3 SV=1 [Tsukamurella paurometabola]|uniref:Transcriptional regulator, LysR family n=1 Tax=Tsukamurella paurometabola (strain ATCC 8368 / DSM 20162 / CCUG 35730 / CIP 100753 / JCM 10117 / KCTC 9821 / NBRC 16120 / NCIMB 702349 / NCTC 13040) TaxID=521096 RepID=D5UY05_TSUPD|nr:LysR family transcriptional regulator [Tsukamurella paurometabola]ADG80242.1 transcriptional regulator, LysR family [Tsukamurella paurometabola DSM 20162]SUP38976.1 Ben and cat operon transcriptional regulator [Tsukamurella paurometabola]
MPAADSVPDLRRLEQFVAAMEEPSLSTAAARLHLSQQALSAALKQLERELGVELFVRSGRRLSPTAAARTLYDGAPTLLAGARQLALTARKASAAAPPPFVVGRSPAVTAQEAYALLEPLIAHPDSPSITVRELFPSAMARELQQGTVDLVVRRGATIPDELAGATLTYHALRIALHRDHPLAQRNSFELADLADSAITVWAPQHASSYTDFLAAQCRRAGFEPDLVVNRVQGTPPVTAVLTQPRAVAFVTDPVGEQFDGQVLVRDLSDAPKVPLQALWLPYTRNRLRSALLAAYPD